MSIEEQNKEIVRRAFEAETRPDWATRMPEYLDTSDAALWEGFKQGHAVFLNAFPDFSKRIDDLFAEGDRVVAITTVRGTFQREFPVAEFAGLAPTGKTAEWREVNILRLRDGRIVGGDLIIDGVSRLVQLGLLRQPAGQG